MTDHRLDRLALRLAGRDDRVGVAAGTERSRPEANSLGGPISRRRLLGVAAVGTAVLAWPLRIPTPGRAGAATVTSCDCHQYGTNVFGDCFVNFASEVSCNPKAGNVSCAAVLAVAREAGRQTCLFQADQAEHLGCNQTSCTGGKTCVTPSSGLVPTCQCLGCNPPCAPGDQCNTSTCACVARA
jgi:hypothetical protein